MQSTSRFQRSLARQITGLEYESPYTARYASNWSSTARRIKKMTGGYCSFLGCWRKAKEVHHTVYRDKSGKPIAGKETEFECYPLCEWHHGDRHKDAAHHPLNWNKGILPPPTLDARNTTDYWLLLRQGWLEKTAWVERQQSKQGRSA